MGASKRHFNAEAVARHRRNQKDFKTQRSQRRRGPEKNRAGLGGISARSVALSQLDALLDAYRPSDVRNDGWMANSQSKGQPRKEKEDHQAQE